MPAKYEKRGETVQGINGQEYKVLRKNFEGVKDLLKGLKDEGFKSIAIVFMHSYAYPEHELFIAKIAKDVGFEQISQSHEVMPRIKIVK